MNRQDTLGLEHWTKKTCGSSQLNDIRRTGRAVKAAKRMAENPSATLPAQMRTRKETMAVYRLLKDDEVTFEALMQPHWQQTREQIATRLVVLRVLDTTEVDLSHYPKTKGLGQVGNERGRGLYLPASADRPATQRRGVGLCDARTRMSRTPAPRGETRGKRRQRNERETDVWMRQVTRFPAETTAVHVGDRGAEGCK
jgi:transposase-like protein